MLVTTYQTKQCRNPGDHMYFPKIKFEITLQSMRQWKELRRWYPRGLFALGFSSRYLYSRCPLFIRTTCPAHPFFRCLQRQHCVAPQMCYWHMYYSLYSGTHDWSEASLQISQTYFNTLLPYNRRHFALNWNHLLLAWFGFLKAGGPSTYKNFMAIAFKLTFRIRHWECPSISRWIRN
jgi:hypothetical protein